MHVHSSASFDCETDPKVVARECLRLGLNPVVLTDHDSIEGAQALVDAGVPTIIGQEVTTAEGEMIGLFLTQRVPAGLSPDAAIESIHEQGGLVYLEHPYDMRRRRLSDAALDRLQSQIDVVEVYNARAGNEANRRAADLCSVLGCAAGAGSDAHTPSEIGRAYVELEPFAGARDFLVKVRSGRVVGPASRNWLRLRRLLKF